MKTNFTYLLLATLVLWLFSSNLNAQTVILTEDFESGSLPTGWSRTQSVNSVGWEFGTDAQLESQYFSIPAHSKFACSNDDKHDDNSATSNIATEDRLITPMLDLSSNNAVIVSFSSFFQDANGSAASLEMTLNGGASWTPVEVIAQTEGAWATTYVNVPQAAGYSSVQFAFRHNDNGQWADGWAIDDVEIFEPEAYEVGLISLNNERYVSPGLYSITGTIRNYGGAELNSLLIKWTTDNWTTTNSQVLTGLSVVPFAYYDFTHSIGLDMTAEGMYDLQVTVEAPNGNLDPTVNDNTLSKPLTTIVQLPNKKVLLEEFTGAWCQYCPDGQLRVINMLNSNTNLIGIGVHYGDGMQNANSLSLNQNFADGWPSGMVDRTKYDGDDEAGISRNRWQTRVNDQLDALTPAKVSAISSYNASTRVATVNVTTEFTSDVKGDYRVSLIVVEDSVTGTGSGYDQVNYYNSDANHPYYQAGNPIVGYDHLHVMRTILGGTWGESGVIPNNAIKGTAYSKTYSYTIPSAYDDTQVSFVAVVQYYNSEDANDRHILNAVEIELNDNQTTGPVVDSLTESIGVMATTINAPTCLGDASGEATVTASGAAPFTFVWSDGGTGASRTGLATAEYTVTVTDANNATASTTVVVGANFPINVFSNEIQLSAGIYNVEVSAEGGASPYTFEWSTGASGNVAIGLSDGSYTVTVTDAIGCEKVETISVGTGATGIGSAQNQFSMSVYPNPTSGSMYITAELGNTEHNVTVEVYNAVGEVVLSQDLGQVATINSTVDMAKFSNGIYFIRLKAGEHTSMSRIVLEK